MSDFDEVNDEFDDIDEVSSFDDLEEDDEFGYGYDDDDYQSPDSEYEEE